MKSKYEIVVNAMPLNHTFYSNPQDQEQGDADWACFDAQEGHSYEIHALGLSKHGYSIQLSLYDSKGQPICDYGHPVTVKNSLRFTCPQSGKYLLEVKPASSYPPEGVEYSLGISDPLEGDGGNLLVKVKDPDGIAKLEVPDPLEGVPGCLHVTVQDLGRIAKLEAIEPRIKGINLPPLYPLDPTETTKRFFLNGISPGRPNLDFYNKNTNEKIASFPVTIEPRNTTYVSVSVSVSISLDQETISMDQEIVSSAKKDGK
jgi:hypothetical protein